MSPGRRKEAAFQRFAIIVPAGFVRAAIRSPRCTDEVDAAVACRVLIVEDDRDASEVMALFVDQRADCQVWVAESVGEAVGSLRARLPTHILLDLMLPDYAGAELLRVVREHNLPVRIALVTAAGPESRAVLDAMRWRPDTVFCKPVRLADVSDWLDSRLDAWPHRAMERAERPRRSPVRLK